ncbi:MAG: hypothetical protein PHQ58_07440 [Rhodoferax sp.]|uniref:hypothetical protein n=1 Tax=Rhodoferax sp. TaxID=50421 RepID=UPI0026176752|nr:hypothetical protein [Rhodoferax sp.]MDD2880255.1 hypothetical protein [Rhodoferax sp.]
MVLIVPQPVKKTAASNGNQKSLRIEEFTFFLDRTGRDADATKKDISTISTY